MALILDFPINSLFLIQFTFKLFSILKILVLTIFYVKTFLKNIGKVYFKQFTFWCCDLDLLSLSYAGSFYFLGRKGIFSTHKYSCLIGFWLANIGTLTHFFAKKLMSMLSEICFLLSTLVIIIHFRHSIPPYKNYFKIILENVLQLSTP